MERGRRANRGIAATLCACALFGAVVLGQAPALRPSATVKSDPVPASTSTDATAAVPPCETDANCDDRQACTLDVCLDGFCIHQLMPDCVPCKPVFDCDPVQLVFLMDTSGSMRDEAAALCTTIDEALNALGGLGIEVIPFFFGITETPGGEFSCLTDTVVHQFGPDVPGDAASCPFPNTLSAYESWGPATAIVAQHFPWGAATTRMIVPISDEGPCDGSRPEGCADPGSDRDSITNAIAIATANQVHVSPISGSGSDACVLNLADALADGTGGTALRSKFAKSDLSQSIVQLILSQCESPNRCDDRHACTTNDTCVDGACVGTPVVNCPFEECADDASCDDHDACTIDQCNLDLWYCRRPYIAGFDPSSRCCDPADGSITVRADADECTGDVCSLPNSRGVAQHPVLPSTADCGDGDPCTTGDHCDGVHSQANGGCIGADVNTISCVDGSCPIVNELSGESFDCGYSGQCTCTPDLTFDLVDSTKTPTCIGGQNGGGPCVSDADCPGGTCNDFAQGGNCFDEGDKIDVRLHLGSASARVSGGEFLLTYDPTCVSLNRVAGVSPYTVVVNGPVHNIGSVYIAVSLTPGDTGLWGDVDIVSLSFTKVGHCDECDLGVGEASLVDDAGQRVSVSAQSKTLRERPELTLDVPNNVSANVDCDTPTARVTWGPPTASSDCGPVQLTCRGRHESGLEYSLTEVMQGGVFPVGISTFCCFAKETLCDQSVGCTGTLDECLSSSGELPYGCWTVETTDQTVMDVTVQLSPPILHNDNNGELTRCIKFCLFATLLEQPYCFSKNLTFGGLFNYNGVADTTIEIPGTTRWSCITAQDQLHTLRSCYNIDHSADCRNGALHAEFAGDPGFDGNWLVGGNLDGYQKDDTDPGTEPSLDVIDLIDFALLVSHMGVQYADNDTPCGTPGPNADLNADGFVDANDYNAFLRNVWKTSKECCGGPQTGSAGSAITEITISELRAMGLKELAIVDLNGDGLLSLADMDAFAAGARPAKGPRDRGRSGGHSPR